MNLCSSKSAKVQLFVQESELINIMNRILTIFNQLSCIMKQSLKSANPTDTFE